MTGANRVPIGGNDSNRKHSSLGSFGPSEASFSSGAARIKQEAGSRNVGRLIKDCRMVIDMLSLDISPPTRTIFTQEDRSKQGDIGVSERLHLSARRMLTLLFGRKCLEKELSILLDLFDMSIADQGD